MSTKTKKIVTSSLYFFIPFIVVAMLAMHLSHTFFSDISRYIYGGQSLDTSFYDSSESAGQLTATAPPSSSSSGSAEANSGGCGCPACCSIQAL